MFNPSQLRFLHAMSPGQPQPASITSAPRDPIPHEPMMKVPPIHVKPLPVTPPLPENPFAKLRAKLGQRNGQSNK